MAQILTQQQKLEQRQQLSAQQVLVAKLTELSVEELRARIETECEENPWLERKENNDYDSDYEASDSSYDNTSDSESDGSDSAAEQQHTTSEDDDWDGNEFPLVGTDSTNGRTREDGDVQSFHDLLLQQMGEYELTEHENTLLEYLIGSLDDDGLLRTPLYQVADELDISHGIVTNEQELERVLTVLQEFEPYGVGARNLCECLLIQVKHYEHLPMHNQLVTMFSKYANEFVQKHWDVIQRRMKLTDSEVAAMKRSILRLNPRPGGSIGRSMTDAAQIIVPDFAVTTDGDDQLHFTICEQGIPALQMSSDPEEWLSTYDTDSSERQRQEVMEAIRYQRNLMDRGNMFINALVQRKHSMTAVMQTILKLQETFFREGDETLLRPMRLEDVAERTNLDISTVSRVCRNKTVSTPFGTYPLRRFFTSSTTKEGEELSVEHILNALKALVDNEDKKHPYSDEYLTTALQRQGYDVARRTVAKYREQLGIPNSRMRR